MRPLAATAKKASAVMALIRADRWRERVREARCTVCVLKKEFWIHSLDTGCGRQKEHKEYEAEF